MPRYLAGNFKYPWQKFLLETPLPWIRFADWNNWIFWSGTNWFVYSFIYRCNGWIAIKKLNSILRRHYGFITTASWEKIYSVLGSVGDNVANVIAAVFVCKCTDSLQCRSIFFAKSKERSVLLREMCGRHFGFLAILDFEALERRKCITAWRTVLSL